MFGTHCQETRGILVYLYQVVVGCKYQYVSKCHFFPIYDNHRIERLYRDCDMIRVCRRGELLLLTVGEKVVKSLNSATLSLSPGLLRHKTNGRVVTHTRIGQIKVSIKNP